MNTRPEREFPATGIIDLYIQLENLGILIWIDGGWGVDALLGQQTRPHADVDIVIQQKDVEQLRALLESQGYSDEIRDDTTDYNFVLTNAQGHSVDVHVIVFDEQGNGMYGPREKGDMYPADSLMGSGTINNTVVRCISPQRLVEFHTGYPLRESDYHDVKALCKKFGIPLPEGSLSPAPGLKAKQRDTYGVHVSPISIISSFRQCWRRLWNRGSPSGSL